MYNSDTIIANYERRKIWVINNEIDVVFKAFYTSGDSFFYVFTITTAITSIISNELNF